MNLKKLALHKWRPFLLFYLHPTTRSHFATTQSSFFDSLASPFHRRKAMFFCAFPASSPSSSFVCASVLCAPGPVSPFSPSARGRPRSPPFSALPRSTVFTAPARGRPRSSAVFRLASFRRFHRARSRPSPFLRRFPPYLVPPFSPPARGRPRSSAVFRLASFLRFHRARSRPSPFLRRFPPYLVSPFSPPVRGRPRSSAVFRLASFLRFHRARSRPSPFLRRFPPYLVSPFSPAPFAAVPVPPPFSALPRFAVFAVRSRPSPFLRRFPPCPVSSFLSAARVGTKRGQRPCPGLPPPGFFDRLVDGAAGFPATAAPRLRRKPVAFRGRSLQSGDVGSGAWEIPPQTPFVPRRIRRRERQERAIRISILEGQSPPNAIRTRRHARRVRKPCAARFPLRVLPGRAPQAQGKRVLAEKGRQRRPFSTNRKRERAWPFRRSPGIFNSLRPRAGLFDVPRRFRAAAATRYCRA